MIKRFIHGTVWLKLLAVGMVLAGMSEKSASLITGGLGLALCAKQVRDGIREQFWESPEDQAARHWEDLVWGHSQWVNPETPDEGIVRLTGPFHPPAGTPEPKISNNLLRRTTQVLHKYNIRSTFVQPKSNIEDYNGPHFIR